jgi:uncharacterized membrane protein
VSEDGSRGSSSQRPGVDTALFSGGKFFFAISLAFFGAQYLYYGHFVGGLLPAQDWTPSLPVLAYAFGIALVAAGVLIFVPSWAQRTALMFGLVMCACVVLVNYAHLGVVIAHGNERTRAFEPVAIGAGALVLAAALSGNWDRSRSLDLAGRVLFGASLCVFGVQHFLYTAYIATLIPPWVPAHVALVYAAGVGFIAGGISIATRLQVRIGAGLLGMMFLLFVGLVQIPPLVAQPTNGALWTSLFVPLALCGGSWIAATGRR